MSHTSREPPLCYAKLEFSRVYIILNDKSSRIESLSLIPDLCALLCITPPIRLSRASNSICMPIFRVISYASIDLIRSSVRCVALHCIAFVLCFLSALCIHPHRFYSHSLIHYSQSRAIVFLSPLLAASPPLCSSPAPTGILSHMGVRR